MQWVLVAYPGQYFGYAEGLISRGLEIQKLVVRVVIGVYYRGMRLVAKQGIELAVRVSCRKPT